MKLLRMDGSEYGPAPADLVRLAPPLGHTLAVEGGRIAFVRVPAGLRFYAPRDLVEWERLQAVSPSWAAAR